MKPFRPAAIVLAWPLDLRPSWMPPAAMGRLDLQGIVAPQIVEDNIVLAKARIRYKDDRMSL